MNKTAIATFENIGDIVDLRVEMQIEDWHNTWGKDFSCYSDEFAQITKKHLEDKLNRSIFFAVMYMDDKPVAMAALEELSELPQITVCNDKNGRHCCLVSVYTKPDYRGKGYQQQVIKRACVCKIKRFYGDHTYNEYTWRNTYLWKIRV